MGLFKNGVGRPSNETLRKRKIAYICIIIALSFLLCVSVVLTVKEFRTVSGISKNATPQKESCTPSDKKNDCKNQDNETVTTLKIIDNCSKNIHVTASAGLRKVLVEYTYTTKCKKWGLFKGTYYESCDKTSREIVNLSSQTSYIFKPSYNKTLKKGTIYVWDKEGNKINRALNTYC